MKTDVTTQSIQDKLKLRISPLVFIGISFALIGTGAFALFGGLNQLTQPRTAINKPKLSNAELQTRFVTRANDYLRASTPSDQATKLSALKTAAAERQTRMATLLSTNPDKFIDLAVPGSDWAQLPAEVQPLVEQAVEVSGELIIVHTDNLTTRISHNQHMLVSTADEVTTRTPVYFAADPSSDTLGATVELQGWQLNGKFVTLGSVETTQVISEPQSAALTTGTTKKVAVILFNFASNPIQPITPAEAYRTMFDDPLSVKALYQKSSGGQLTLDGGSEANMYVFGWYTITASTASCSTVDWLAWLNDATDQAPAGALDGFDYYVFASPRVDSCGFGGVTTIPGNRSFNNGNFSTVEPYGMWVAAHELGHNFNTMHANSLECVDATTGQPTSISSICTSWEYGDPYDPMGWPRGRVPHFSNYNQKRFGWYAPENTQDVTTSGTYTLYPIEADVLPGSVRALRIPTQYRYRHEPSPGNPNPSYLTYSGYYYLEYRRPYQPFDTFNETDAVVNGLSLRLATGDGVIGWSHLVDLTPATRTYTPNYDAALLPGMTYTDTLRGLSLSVTIPPDKLTAAVTVSLICAHQVPGLFNVSNSKWVQPGQPKSFTFIVKNNDLDYPECGSSTFSVIPDLPLGWTHSTIPSYVLAPGRSTAFSFTVTAPVGTPDGFYPASLRAYSPSRSELVNTFSLPLAVDTLPPTSTVVTPANGITLPRSGTVTVTTDGQNAPSDPAARKDIIIDGVTVKVCVASVGGSGIDYPCTYQWAVGGLQPGTHTIESVVFDQAGNIGRQSIVVYYPASGGGGIDPIVTE